MTRRMFSFIFRRVFAFSVRSSSIKSPAKFAPENSPKVSILRLSPTPGPHASGSGTGVGGFVSRHAGVVWELVGAGSGISGVDPTSSASGGMNVFTGGGWQEEKEEGEAEREREAETDAVPGADMGRVECKIRIRQI